MRAVLFLGLAATAGATCLGEQCEEEDGAALLQFREQFGPITPRPTPAPEPTPAEPSVVFGTPLSGYHNVTIWTYVRAMEKVNFKIHEVVVKFEHAILYPMFLGVGGEDVCESAGCPEKCAEVGLGYRSPCVDFVVDSNIPVNHASYIEAYQDQYLVMGTAFETQYIALWAPAYTGWKDLYAAQKAGADLAEPPVIYGQMAGVGEGCDTLYCPKCPGAGYVTGPPLVDADNAQNWTFKSVPCTEYIEAINTMLDEKKEFLAQYWTPNVLAHVFNERMVPLDMYPYVNKPNEGKALIRRDSISKFTDVAYAALGAIYIGTEDVRAMDAWSHGFNLTVDGECDFEVPPPASVGGEANGQVNVNVNVNVTVNVGGKGGKGPPASRRRSVPVPNSAGQGPCPLCDFMSWDFNCALEAADRWINLNSDKTRPDGVVQPGVWPSFFW